MLQEEKSRAKLFFYPLSPQRRKPPGRGLRNGADQSRDPAKFFTGNDVKGHDRVIKRLGFLGRLNDVEGHDQVMRKLGFL